MPNYGYRFPNHNDQAYSPEYYGDKTYRVPKYNFPIVYITWVFNWD